MSKSFRKFGRANHSILSRDSINVLWDKKHPFHEEMKTRFFDSAELAVLGQFYVPYFANFSAPNGVLSRFSFPLAVPSENVSFGHDEVKNHVLPEVVHGVFVYENGLVSDQTNASPTYAIITVNWDVDTPSERFIAYGLTFVAGSWDFTYAVHHDDAPHSWDAWKRKNPDGSYDPYLGVFSDAAWSARNRLSK